MIPATLRFGYMLRIAMPYFGKRMLMRDGSFVRFLLNRGDTRQGGWTDYEQDTFSDQFREPERATASSRLYGSFLFREYLQVGLLGKYRKYRMYTPTRLLFGEKDFALAHSWLRGYEKYVDDFSIEMVPDTGHFIVDERPELVNERALAFFMDPKYNVA
jgi:pimeloyl-ACP methyl ester carboxylesterase